MGIFGAGGMNGEEAAQRRQIMQSIATETDIARLGKYIALDQTDYWYDPCGKSGNEVNNLLTDMSKLAVARIYEIMAGYRPTITHKVR